MPETSARSLLRSLLATAVVLVIPVTVTLSLRESGAISGALLVPLAVCLSIGVSLLGAVGWRARREGGDVVFSDLMIWNWLGRVRAERLLASAPATFELELRDCGEVGRRFRLRRLERLSTALDSRSPYVSGHSRRVARHATRIAKRMGLSAEEVARIRAAAVLHDVGKIFTPVEVLEKPAALTEAEYDVVKLHPATGARMVSVLGDEELTAIVHHHHERLDGGGYPDGLRGEEIPLGARIVAVADVFDATTSARPYRRALSHGEAFAVLEEEAGTGLDPAAVKAFRSYYAGVGGVAAWSTLANLPRQLPASLADVTRAGALLPAAKSVAVVAAALAVGSAVIPVPGTSTPRSTAGAPAMELAADPAAGAVSASPPPTAASGASLSARSSKAAFVRATSAGAAGGEGPPTETPGRGAEDGAASSAPGGGEPTPRATESSPSASASEGSAVRSGSHAGPSAEHGRGEKPGSSAAPAGPGRPPSSERHPPGPPSAGPAADAGPPAGSGSPQGAAAPENAGLPASAGPSAGAGPPEGGPPAAPPADVPHGPPSDPGKGPPSH